ncbi:uncharacterized protein LOC117821766 isoform X2 [Notolabrus celidotus]|uniref:uncharacterized protein LOC117821766 isoform X2 n=1 Tax=Notolabrus celidotus TaxID=1203425 RepID=UPI0014900741|nr:uncharacterized protein LOC117821766 isoform X2 [Notolabrus celidotus]
MIRMAKPLLKKAVVNLLKIAEQHNLCSVAIPAISSGIFNFPLPLCADVIVTTIKQYCKQKKANSPPFKLHLVNNDNKTVREMERACKKILSCHEDKDMPPTAKVHLQPPDKANTHEPTTMEKTELHEEEEQVNFDSYKAIVSFVNIRNVHWQFLYLNAAESSVYLVDPATNSNEQGESDNAAQRFRDYFKMRRICHGKTDWVDIKLKGNVMHHPVQQDSNSCGVIVTMMAKAVMEAFPQPPRMTFGTTTDEMAVQRKHFALQILKASVFNTEANCAMCAATKPPAPGPSFTDWIQCDSCCRWFHKQCLQMDTAEWQKMKNVDWKCILCKK